MQPLNLSSQKAMLSNQIEQKLREQLLHNLDLIQKIHNYKKFFDKLEERKKIAESRKKRTGPTEGGDLDFAQQLRAIPGGREMLNEKGEIDLTVDDVKQGRKLDVIMKFFSRNTKKEQILAEKLRYYKNLKPRQGVYQTNEMDVHQRIQQEAFKRNQMFLEEKHLKDKMTDQAREQYERLVAAEGLGAGAADGDLDYLMYKRLRKDQERARAKSNVELLEQFNESALKFLPLFKKRVDQIQEMERIN